MIIPDKSQLLTHLLEKRILVLDGAMGTSLQTMNLTSDDFGGDALLGCNEHLIISNPAAIQTVHERYLAVGADIIETNTFGATPLVLAEYDIADKCYEINFKAVEIAQKAIAKFETPQSPRFIAGSIGPTTKSLSVTGGISFDGLVGHFEAQAIPLIDAGADYLLLETAIDTLNLKAAYIGILNAFNRLNKRLPVAISGTIETMGTMLAGQGVEALITSVEHMNPLYVGLNCATGPEFMRDHIRTMASIAPFPVAVAPNAGIPDPDGRYPENPQSLAETLHDFVSQGWINIVGGCCGTTPDHIRELVSLTNGRPRDWRSVVQNSRVSGMDPLIIEPDNRPYIVGERTNVIGSRAFKTLISDGKFEEAAEIARKQVKAGAHIVDVCLSNPDRDEISDIHEFMTHAARLVKAPFMIDSQVPEVIETAFKLTQGKCILNSINLEDDGKNIKALVPIVKRYGASVVVGCIDSEMAVTAQDKLRIATDSYSLLTESYGIAPEDIIFDPLVFPCGTGDAKYFGSGRETIEGIRLIKEKYPRCKTVLGISNVSFGLPTAGREVLNSVFLYLCTRAGLDMAIVNSEKLVRFAQISDIEKELCYQLIDYDLEKSTDPVADFAAHFRGKKVQTSIISSENLSIEERIEINIVQGTKENLIANLDDALTQWDPLGVINNPLMRAMDIVGKMFNENELIVAEVLQSAEVMKTAVGYLEQFMSKAETNVRGTMLLATVKGDVHDIGKNLVQIILGNNGYKVVDLGIKCGPETLIQAYHDHHPDLIGLSGLLVKSAQQMVITANDLKAAGINIPILVGGAALTEAFTATKIAPEYGGPVIYCKDAMTGLAVANSLMDPTHGQSTIEKIAQRQDEVRSANPTVERGASKRDFKEKLTISHDVVRSAPTLQRTVFNADIGMIWDYLNLQMVFGNHLGYKGNVKTNLARGDEKLSKLVDRLNILKARILNENLLTATAVIQYFNARSEGNSILIYDDLGKTIIERFTFPRQSEGLKLCLADFVASDHMDTIAMFVATSGNGVAQIAKDLLDAGDYFDSHGLSALALESAEAFAELIHKKIRTDWGIPDDPSLTPDDLFKLKYTGVRMSFGYPACPRLEDQVKMFKLLHPEGIGITLSEEYMMHPEASVSALVFHHPQGRYFTISETDLSQFEKNILQSNPGH